MGDLRESDHRLALDALLGLGNPFEAMEERGQAKLCSSSMIPIDLHPSVEAWEKVGFRFEPSSDPLFYDATFPKGWSIRAAERAMWSDVVDADGRKRGSVFYKASSYDRSANACLMEGMAK